jgi:hypothetical protein
MWAALGADPTSLGTLAHVSGARAVGGLLVETSGAQAVFRCGFFGEEQERRGAPQNEFGSSGVLGFLSARRGQSR